MSRRGFRYLRSPRYACHFRNVIACQIWYMDSGTLGVVVAVVGVGVVEGFECSRYHIA
jgi:hypothetical protein